MVVVICYVYLSGYTTGSNLPVVNAFQSTNQGGKDAFVTTFAPSGTELVYSTYLGGTNDDLAYDLTYAWDGSVYVVGETASVDFPTVNPITGQETYQGAGDSFLASIDTRDIGVDSVKYATYVGGTLRDLAWDVGADSLGHPYVVGRTWSSDFPLVNPYQDHLVGADDLFIYKDPTEGPPFNPVFPQNVPAEEFTTPFDQLDPDRFPARCQFQVQPTSTVYFYETPDDVLNEQEPSFAVQGGTYIVPFAYWKQRGGYDIGGNQHVDIVFGRTGDSESNFAWGWVNLTGAVSWVYPNTLHNTQNAAVNQKDDPALTPGWLADGTNQAIERCEHGVYVVCRYHLEDQPIANLGINSTFTDFQQFFTPYGITLYQDGISLDYITNNVTLPSGVSAEQYYNQYHRDWTNAEFLALANGVATAADAFSIISACPDVSNPNDPAAAPAAIFRDTMGDFTIFRVQDGFSFGNASPCNEANGKGCTDNTVTQSISFFGGVLVDEYVLVHEMGHRFNARSGQTLSSSVNDASVYDTRGNPYVVFGWRTLRDDNGQTFNVWERGERGWGSGPARTTQDAIIFSAFQKNPTKMWSLWQELSQSDRITRVDETTADMFLNWVYREAIITAGFLNRDWRVDEGFTTPEGHIDPTLPGYFRFNWMHTTMHQIFAQQPWN